MRTIVLEPVGREQICETAARLVAKGTEVGGMVYWQEAKEGTQVRANCQIGLKEKGQQVGTLDAGEEGIILGTGYNDGDTILAQFPNWRGWFRPHALDLI